MTGDPELSAVLADVELAAALRDLDATLAILAAYGREHDPGSPS